MRTMRKSRISVALAAALAGVGASTQVGAMHLSQDNIGDAAIGPYYTVRDGWSTDFTVINTSDSTLAVKVRFHEARNSREVLDFIVVLSPRDVIAGWVEEGPTGPRVRFPDNGETSCVVPTPTGRAANGNGGWLDFSNAAYFSPGDWDGYRQTGPEIDPTNEDDVRNNIDRAREGYFTIIEMGSDWPGQENVSGTVAFNAKHVSNKPRDCNAVVAAFDLPNIVNTYNQFDRNLNAIKLNYALTNVGRGIQAGGGGVHLANFATAVSNIAHTQTSILAGQGAVDTAKATLTAATTDVASKQSAVKSAVDNCASTASVTSVGNGAYNANSGSISIFDDDENDDDLIVATAYGLGVCQNAGAGKTALDNATLAYNNSVNAFYTAEDKYAAAVIAQFLTPPENLISAQVPGWFQDPDLDSGDHFAAYLVPGLNSQASNGKYPAFPWPAVTWGYYIRGADAVTALLMRSNALNEWGNNPITGAQTDFVLTAPTKNFYTDFDYVYRFEPHLELISPMLANLLSQMPIGIPPFSEQFNEDSPQACDPIRISLWNRDEVGTSSGVQPSPQLSSQLCWESNILYTGDESVLASKVGQHVNTAVLTSDPLLRTNGWLNVGMAVQAYQYHPAFPITAAFPLHTWFFRYPDSVCLSDNDNGPPVPVDQCVNYPGFVPGDVPPDGPVDEFLVQLGMPYLGFAIKERGFGQAASYAALWDHSYLRSYEARNAIGGVPPSFFRSIFGSDN